MENLYAPMRNLSRHLPSNEGKTSTTNWNEVEAFKSLRIAKNEDEESEICSVIIPPPLPPVQSHAVLEKSLGHEIPVVPRTPSTLNRSLHHPPTLPKRTNSKLLATIKSPKSSTANQIYANLNRSSLMSTGSSEGSSSSEVMSPAATVSTASTTSEAMFAWPNYSVMNSISSENEEQNHRSVSQIGEDHSSAASEASGSYVKMNLRSSRKADKDESGEFVIYQDTSSYVNMNVKKLPNANIEAIYAQPQSVVSSRSSSSSRKKSKKLSSEFKHLMQEVSKKRQYRVGLNLFNTRPELGIEYLASKGFIELSSDSVGKFLYHENGGLSMEKVGDYLGSLQSPFAMKVLSYFMQEFNFSGQRIDKSLRSLLQRVRVPGEAQKIEKIMEVFGKRYASCNPQFAAKLKSPDSIVTLAFAIILLNTDLHSPNLKVDKKMTVNEFMNNLRGVDAGRDFDCKLLKQIYKGIKKTEFVTGLDHVLQVSALQNSIEGSKNLVQAHRRLVCLCRLFEVTNINSRKENGSHQRDLFLFNDLLLVTKMTSKGSNGKSANYTQRHSVPLQGLEVTLFHTPVYDHGIQLSRKSDGEVLLTLNAGSEHDRYKFVMDLQESIYEMDLMDEAAKTLSM